MPDFSYDEIRDMIRAKLNPSEDGPYIYVRDVFEKDVVYEEDGKLFRAPYSITEDGEVELGSPERVKAAYEEFAELSDVEILATGVHRSLSGQVVTVTDEDLDHLAAKFAELKGEITPPLMVSHADGDLGIAITTEAVGGPVAGWMSKVYKKGQKLLASFSEVPAQAAEKIGESLKKVSAEFYTDYIDSNGTAHGRALRKVSFVPIPAVKGLADVTQANLAFGETPDQPTEVILFGEGVTEGNNKQGGNKVDPKLMELQKKVDELVAKFGEQGGELSEAQKRIKELEAENSAAVTKLSESEKATRRQGIQSFVDGLKSEGKVTPALEAMGLVSFMEGLADGEGADVIKLSEGGKEVSKTPFQFFKDLLSTAKPVVKFGELGEGGSEEPGSGYTQAELEVFEKMGVSPEDVAKFAEGPVKTEKKEDE